MRRGRTGAWLSAAVLLCLGGCHGRPLAARIVPPPGAAGPAGAIGNPGRTPYEVGSLSGEIAQRGSVYSPIQNKAGWSQMNRAVAAVAARDARTSIPESQPGWVRRHMDEVMAHPAAPSWEDPQKGGICDDNILIGPLLLAQGLAMILSGRAKELRRQTRAKAARSHPVIRSEEPVRTAPPWER